VQVPKCVFLSYPRQPVAHYRYFQANGFYGSKGISSRLPEGYTWLEQRFMTAVRASQPQNPRSVPGSVELKEWNRQGWTYHAKGAPTAFPHELKLTVAWFINCRDLAFTKSRVSARPHPLWFNKPQLALGTPRHRIVLCNARKL